MVAYRSDPPSRQTPRGSREARRPPKAPIRSRAAPRRGPVFATALALLAAFLLLEHAGALSAPFFSDDYIFLDKMRHASFLAVWQPSGLAYHWYRPWSRELHYLSLFRIFGLNPLPYHVVNFTLWLAVLGLYFALAVRTAGRGIAAIASAAVAALALWIVPIEWAAGAQELWMLLFVLLALHAHAHRRIVLAMMALSLALLSKETAAVLPIIAFAYSLLVERAGWRDAARRAVPLVALVMVWAALHPALGGRFWWAQSFTPLPSVRTPPLRSAGQSLFALLNLDLAPAPQAGWKLALMVALPGALALGLFAWRGVAALASRAESASPPESAALPDAGSAPRVLVFGAVWALAAWLPLLSPSVLWQPYYAALGALGAWLAIGAAAARVRWLAVPLVLALALLRGARAETPSRDWGNIVLQRFGKSFMGVTESYLREGFPTLPRHTRLFFTTVPRGVVFLTGNGDAPALRVWYGDATITGGYWGEFRPRTARDSLGPDYFFRYDSLAGWIEIQPGPENLDAAQAANPGWEADHEKLARTFVVAGDLRRAATEYEKLAGVYPGDAGYAYLAGLAFAGLGVRDSAALWLTRAASLQGADAEMRRNAVEYASGRANR